MQAETKWGKCPRCGNNVRFRDNDNEPVAHTVDDCGEQLCIAKVYIADIGEKHLLLENGSWRPLDRLSLMETADLLQFDTLAGARDFCRLELDCNRHCKPYSLCR